MQAFLNCSVKMFENCKQTGHRRRQSARYHWKTGLREKTFRPVNVTFWVLKAESHLGAFAERDRQRR